MSEDVACCALCYVREMIVSIRHKGLRRLFEKGETQGVGVHHHRRLRLQLAALNTARTIEDMDVPGWRLHRLKGPKPAVWSITVDKNWRLTFEFRDGNVFLLDYEDYH